jgi:hypothetical protein
VTISVAVMAHPKRKDSAEALATELRSYPFVSVNVIYDTADAASHQDEWDNGTRSLLDGVGKASWHVVVQDDAILSPGFYDNLQGAIATVPTKSLISLYTGTSRPFGVRVKNAVDKVRHETWLSYWLLMWGVGILIPSDHIEPMIEFVSDRTEPYDTRIGIFYQRNRLPVYYTMPSLVNHDDALGTLLPGHGTEPGARVAHKFATGPLNWNSKCITI